MIITCNNCKKSFYIDPDLIPDHGRLVQCGKCDNKWFYNKKNLSVDEQKIPQEFDVDNNNINQDKKINSSISEVNVNRRLDKLTIPNDTESLINQAEVSLNNSKKNIKKNYNILSYTVLFILTFVAFIILIDTFKYPISKIIPNIEFILYNLYETIEDIQLFFKDIIQ